MPSKTTHFHLICSGRKEHLVKLEGSAWEQVLVKGENQHRVKRDACHKFSVI